MGWPFAGSKRAQRPGHPADAYALPFADDRLDHALMLTAPSYSTDPARALSEAARVRRPGRRLVPTTRRRRDRAGPLSRHGHPLAGYSVELRAGLAPDAPFDLRPRAASSREHRPPRFEILTLHASVPGETARTDQEPR